MAGDLTEMFDKLEANASPLTEELYQEMLKQSKLLARTKIDAKEFWSSPSFKRWPGLVQTSRKSAIDRHRSRFLEEWHSTLQELRDIGATVSLAENRPSWVMANAPMGAQTDQFLHAHYYQRAMDGRKANYAALFERNKDNRENALAEAVQWWSSLPSAPSYEDEMLNVTGPFLQAALSEANLEGMDYKGFRDVCMGIHAIKDYSRRVSNKAVGLPSDGTQYSIPEKVTALSRRVWNDLSSNGGRVKDLIRHILYNGSAEQLPERLWQSVSDPKLKIDGLGISALGEMVGWALPDRFPPRNGRTSKSLRSLGFEVKIHSE
jgi:hypothetical protein